jgi:hypothetical protein
MVKFLHIVQESKLKLNGQAIVTELFWFCNIVSIKWDTGTGRSWESHGYAARENILLLLGEQEQFPDKYL